MCIRDRVEIVVTAQEMALLVVKAKQIVGKEMPVIAVVGVKNMFCDMSYFETIYDIRLRTYFASNGAGLKDCLLYTSWSDEQKSHQAMHEGKTAQQAEAQ